MTAILRTAVVLTLVALFAVPAAAQNRRERLTALAEETALRLEKAEADDLRHALSDELESYRHELGYTDARDRVITWQISYVRTLLERLDGELKGLSVAATPAAQARRAWREIARAALQRAETERDEGERLRSAHAAFLLMHNAALIDPLLDQWPKIDAARKALKEDSPEDHRRKLNQAAGAFGQLTQLAGRLSANQVTFRNGEIWQLRQALERIAIGIDVADGKVAPEETPDPDTVPPEKNEAQLAAVAALKERIAKLAAHAPKLAEPLQQYIEQAELGLEHPKARDQAIRLRQKLETATTLAETLSSSTVASSEYRAAHVDRLLASLQKISTPAERDEAYRQIDRQYYEDRFRRYFDQFAMASAVKTALWNTYEQADKNATISKNDNERRINSELRGALDNLAWRAAQHYNEELADRMLAALHARMLKALEADLAAALPVIRARNDQSAGTVWRCIGRLDDVNRLRNIDRQAQMVEEYQSLPTILRTAIGQSAAMLLDADGGNDGQSRNSQGRLLNGLRHMVEFLETGRPTAWFTPEMAGPAGSRVAAAWRSQHNRLIPMVRTHVEHNDTERDILVNTLPIYRITAELALFRHASQENSLPLMSVGPAMSFDPQLLLPLCERATDELVPPLVANLPRAADRAFVDQAAALRQRELVCRAAALALQQRRRQADRPQPLSLLLDELRIAALGDPGGVVRDRWRVSWHANMAADAWRRGYTRTAEHHAAELQRRWVLDSFRLLTREEQK